jgi:hypothetical protein
MACFGIKFVLNHTSEDDALLSKYFSTAQKHFIFMERSTNTYKIGVLGSDNKKAVSEHVVDGLTVIKCTKLSSSGRVYGLICSGRTHKLTTTKR